MMCQPKKRQLKLADHEMILPGSNSVTVSSMPYSSGRVIVILLRVYNHWNKNEKD